ncbi:MAG: phosphatase PAP2 family protein [Rhodospirillales bacterium]|nr:phosphatase PAP2 family protein [Rhodospirillales bacterium]
MMFLTDFADQAVVLPLVFTLALVLAVQRWPRAALALLAATGGTVGLVVVLKLFTIACGPPLLHSPSGHTATAAVVSGGIAVLAGAGAGGAMLVALAGATVIGVSRVALGMHSWAEALLGGAIGVAGALVLARLAGPRPPRLRLRWLAVAVVVVTSVFHGLRLPAEAHIRAASFDAARILGVCRGATR